MFITSINYRIFSLLQKETLIILNLLLPPSPRQPTNLISVTRDLPILLFIYVVSHTIRLWDDGLPSFSIMLSRLILVVAWVGASFIFVA